MLGGYWERKLAVRSRYRNALPAKTGNHWGFLLHRLHSQSQRRHRAYSQISKRTYSQGGSLGMRGREFCCSL